MKKNLKLKASPYHIPAFLYRYGFLILALPAQTFFLSSLNFSAAIFVSIINTSVLTLTVVCACVSYKRTKARLRRNSLIVTKGILLNNKSLIYLTAPTTLCTTQGPVQKLFNVCRITAISSKCRQFLYIQAPSLSSVKKHLGEKRTNVTATFHSNNFDTLMLSLGFYNAFTSALTLIPILRKLYTFSSKQLYSKGTINILSYVNLYYGLPTLIFITCVLIILLWATGVIVTFFRYFKLTLQIGKRTFFIRRGLVIKRTTQAKINSINTVLLRQNLLMILIGRYTGEFRIASEKNTNKVTFLCASNRCRCEKVLSHTGFSANNQGQKISPNSNAIRGYIYLPFSLLVFTCIFIVITDVYIPVLSAYRTGLFLILWLFAWFMFRLCIFTECFAQHFDTYILIGCYKGLSYNLAYIPKEKIRGIQTTESVFQRRNGICTMRVFVKSRKKQAYPVKHIDKEKAAEFITELCGHN